VAVRVLTVFAGEIQVERGRHALDVLVAHAAADPGRVRHDLAATPPAPLRQLTRHIADAVLELHRVALAVESEDRRAAARRMDHAHEELDRRRLPGPIRGEESEDLALRDREVEVEDAARAAVVLRERSGRDRVRQLALMFAYR